MVSNQSIAFPKSVKMLGKVLPEDSLDRQTLQQTDALFFSLQYEFGKMRKQIGEKTISAADEEAPAQH